MQQSSAIPKNQAVGIGLHKIVACSTAAMMPLMELVLLHQLFLGLLL